VAHKDLGAGPGTDTSGEVKRVQTLVVATEREGFVGDEVLDGFGVAVAGRPVDGGPESAGVESVEVGAGLVKRLDALAARRLLSVESGVVEAAHKHGPGAELVLLVDVLCERELSLALCGHYRPVLFQDIGNQLGVLFERGAMEDVPVVLIALYKFAK
jgi:hypothetical protein